MSEPHPDDAQREFDPERDKEAVEKMRKWDKGLESDPVMEQLGGDPWWKAFTDKSKKGTEQQTKTKK